jgi:hypothetical protein
MNSSVIISNLTTNPFVSVAIKINKITKIQSCTIHLHNQEINFAVKSDSLQVQNDNQKHAILAFYVKRNEINYGGCLCLF